MEIKENKKLILELRELLILEDKKPDKRRRVKIKELRETIFQNVKSKMDELGSNHLINVAPDNSVSRNESAKASDKEVYEELKRMYRDAVDIATACKDLKKVMRESK